MGERIRRMTARGVTPLPVRREPSTARDLPKESESLAARYPNLNAWVRGGGWVEIGYNYGASMARALDEGGQIWEGKRK